jgi:hypothetical protein
MTLSIAYGSSSFMMKTRENKILLGLLVVMAAIIAAMWPHLPVDDSPAYFHFVDTRAFIGIPNALDVLSNLGFLVIGLMGISSTLKSRKHFTPTFTLLGLSLSIAMILTCFGSGYFHLTPVPATLTWDRLPMTIGFATIIALVIADRVSDKAGLIAYVLLVPFGFYSVIGFSESWVTLRPYLALQYGSILFTVFSILLLKARVIPSSVFWTCLGLYVAAKIFELKDIAVFNATGFISGHTIKHILAVFAIDRVLSVYRTSRKSL